MYFRDYMCNGNNQNRKRVRTNQEPYFPRYIQRKKLGTINEAGEITREKKIVNGD